MTDQNEDSGQELTGSGQPSSQNVSGGDKHNSNSASQPQDVLGERLTRIEKMLSSIQSGKDRAVDKTRTEVSELRKSLSDVQNLMKKGLSEDEAFEQLEGRKADNEFKQAVLELRDALKGGKSLPVQANGAKVEPSVIEVLNQFNLDANDPDVIANVLSQSDPDKAELAASRLARKRANPPSASAASPVAGTPPPPANLMDEYNQKAKSVRGMALIDLKMEYRKKGLDIN